jgi:hypothetical protein
MFDLFSMSHWANFNQTLQKSFMGWIQVCPNEEEHPSPRGDNRKRVKIH